MIARPDPQSALRVNSNAAVSRANISVGTSVWVEASCWIVAKKRAMFNCGPVELHGARPLTDGQPAGSLWWPTLPELARERTLWWTSFPGSAR
jgi:hypothetical protein